MEQFRPGEHTCIDCVFFREQGIWDRDQKLGRCYLRPPVVDRDALTGGRRPGPLSSAFCAEGQLLPIRRSGKNG